MYSLIRYFSRIQFGVNRFIYRVFIKYCVFFPRILESLPPLPRQHSAAIGCTKIYQPIGMTVHLHSVESFEGLLQRCRREGGVAVNYEKNTIFNEHSVYGLETRGPNLKSNFFLYRPRRCSDDFFILTEDTKRRLQFFPCFDAVRNLKQGFSQRNDEIGIFYLEYYDFYYEYNMYFLQGYSK